MKMMTARALLTAALAIPAICLAATLFAAPRYLTLCWEAEDAQNVSGKAWKSQKFTDDPSGKVSGKRVLSVPHYTPGEHPPKDEVIYKVKVPQDGIYYLWARTYWVNGCGNSFFMQIEGYDSGDWIIGGDGTYNSMHWVCLNDGGNNSGNPRPLQLKKGTVTFTVGAKESATKIDQFLLTTDRKLTPANIYKPTADLLAPPPK